MSVRRVLHIERLEHAKESWQPRQTSAAHRRQLYGAAV